MSYNTYYLGTEFTSIVEQLERLDGELGEDRITLEQYGEETFELRNGIETQPEWLSNYIFECLEEIARDEQDGLVIQTEKLVWNEIDAEALDTYMTDCLCCGFLLLADTPNLAEYVVELESRGWSAECEYRRDTFHGVLFTR